MFFKYPVLSGNNTVLFIPKNVFNILKFVNLGGKFKMKDSGSITILLKQHRGENEEAVNKLIPLIYDQLKLIARRYIIKENKDQTLNTTGLVHETYMRMIKQEVDFVNRGHFYAIVATTMRRILLEAARSKNTVKRGEGASKVAFKEHFMISKEDADHLISVNAALEKLETLDAELATIVELKYFGGLQNKEIAVALSCSESTVKRGWRTAKAWLFDYLKDID